MVATEAWFRTELDYDRARAFVDDEAIKRIIKRDFGSLHLQEQILTRTEQIVGDDILRHFRLDEHLGHVAMSGALNPEQRYKHELEELKKLLQDIAAERPVPILVSEARRLCKENDHSWMEDSRYLEAFKVTEVVDVLNPPGITAEGTVKRECAFCGNVRESIERFSLPLQPLGDDTEYKKVTFRYNIIN